MSDAVISTRGLGRTFGRADAPVRALTGLDLEVHGGEVFGLLGHNGAGKTTTVRLLNGVLEPSQGHASVLGLDPQRDGPRVRARCGVLTETPALDERLAAGETLVLFGRIFGLSKRVAASRASALLDEFGLEERAADRVGTLSKGLKQRLALARTLVHEPQLIFLDEPTTGLDPVAARETHELIQRMTRQERRTVVLCTHNLVEAQRLCSRVAVLRHGELVAQGTPDQLSRRLERGGQVRVTVPAAQRRQALATLRSVLADAKGHPQLRPDEAADTVLLEGATREAVAAGVAALVRAGVEVYAVVPRRPSLEDAYFALVGDDAREPAA